MAAEVSRMSIKRESKSERGGLITRDLLGSCFGIESSSATELDLDFYVPSGCEKRLDLQSGKVYIQRCTTTTTTTTSENPHPTTTGNNKNTLTLFRDTSLDLKLLSPALSPTYDSVCTLDKVKSALDRAAITRPTKKRWTGMMMSTSTSSSLSNSSSSLSVREMMDGEDERVSSTRTASMSSNQNGTLLVAAACPGCMLYVLISKSDPKCPKCNSLVRLPVMSKKPRIDLNISI